MQDQLVDMEQVGNIEQVDGDMKLVGDVYNEQADEQRVHGMGQVYGNG